MKIAVYRPALALRSAAHPAPRKGESPASGGLRGFQDGRFGGGRRVGRQADVWSAHGEKIRATTGDFKKQHATVFGHSPSALKG